MKKRRKDSKNSKSSAESDNEEINRISNKDTVDMKERNAAKIQTTCDKDQ